LNSIHLFILVNRAESKSHHRWIMPRGAVAGVAVAALALAVVALVVSFRTVSQPRVLMQRPQAARHQVRLARTTKLPQMAVSGSFSQLGEAEQAGVPISFEFPVALPEAPPPPGPNVINVGPRPKKVPVCKECVKAEKKVKMLTEKVYADNKKANDVLEQEEDLVNQYESQMREAVTKIDDRVQGRVSTYKKAIDALKTKPGVEGQKGPPGTPGEDGRPGAPGAPGGQGPEGPVGVRGPEGKVGPQGFTGKRGPQGPAGVEGEQGIVGPQGAAGPPGPAGISINGYCNTIGGKVYKGACFKSAVLSENADAVPADCDPYNPVASWEQSDVVALQSLFKDRPTWDQINREPPLSPLPAKLRAAVAQQHFSCERARRGG